MTTKLILFSNDTCCLRFGGNYTPLPDDRQHRMREARHEVIVLHIFHIILHALIGKYVLPGLLFRFLLNRYGETHNMTILDDSNKLSQHILRPQRHRMQYYFAKSLITSITLIISSSESEEPDGKQRPLSNKASLVPSP